MLFLWRVWAYFRLPELKGRTYEELDILFTEYMKARDFKGYVINAYTQVEESSGAP